MTPIKAHVIQHTQLDYAVAEDVLGWRWLAFVDTPVRGTPGYPAECRVRRFFPPDDQLGSPGVTRQWKEWFAKNNPEPANGDEPLAYCYCSSNGPHRPPHPTSSAEDLLAMEKRIHKLKKWDAYLEQLAVQVGSSNSAKLHFAPAPQKCIAALAVVGSRHVSFEEAHA